MGYETILFEVADGVATITLNRPEVMNGLNTAMRREILAATAEAAAARPRAGPDRRRPRLLLRPGPRPHRRSTTTSTSSARSATSTSRCSAPSTTARSRPSPRSTAPPPAPAPTSRSPATWSIAARSAVFIQAFARIGLIPDAGGTYWLPRQIGFARAMGAALFAEPVTAEEAAAWGMIWQAVPDEDFAATVAARAAQLARGPAVAYRLIKQALRAEPRQRPRRPAGARGRAPGRGRPHAATSARASPPSSRSAPPATKAASRPMTPRPSPTASPARRARTIRPWPPTSPPRFADLARAGPRAPRRRRRLLDLPRRPDRGARPTGSRAALAEPPEAAFAAILAAMPADGAAALADSLRIARRRAALLIALADLGGAWGLAEVTARPDRARRPRRPARPRRRSSPRRSPAASSPASPRPTIPEAAGMFVARHGQDGRPRAQLLLRHRPDRALRRDPPRPRRLRRAPPRLHPRHPEAS